MSKLRNLVAPTLTALLGALVSSPAHAVYLRAENASEPSIGDLLASFFGQIISFFAANNGNIVP